MPLDLLDQSPEELVSLLLSWGEPRYRAAQIDSWIYRELVTSFEEMTNLPLPLRARLAAETTLGTLVPVGMSDSTDGLTRKTLFRLPDGESLETVLMLYADAPAAPGQEEREDQASRFDRRTVCISTQVGCPIGCPFCATGQAGYIRNLTSGEIVSQVLYMARSLKGWLPASAALPITNVVIMGMGEPLMKFDVTYKAVQSIVGPGRLGLGARRVTVSTSGLIPGIRRLMTGDLPINLAVSLHAPDDDLRNRLVPINRRYPIRDLLAACREYVGMTRRRVTFEYALMDGVNDRPEQARALAGLLKGMLAHVNLIPLNPTPNSPFGRTPYPRVREFELVLREAGIPTTLRVEKGIEIAAGCGQLKQEHVRAARRIAL